MTRRATTCEKPDTVDLSRKPFALRKRPQHETSACLRCKSGVLVHGSREESSPEANHPKSQNLINTTLWRPKILHKAMKGTGTSGAIILARSCVPKSVKSSSHGFRRLVWRGDALGSCHAGWKVFSSVEKAVGWYVQGF